MEPAGDATDSPAFFESVEFLGLTAVERGGSLRARWWERVATHSRPRKGSFPECDV